MTIRTFRFFFIVALLVSLNVSAQKVDKKLTTQLKETIKGFNGDIGIYVIDLKKDHIVAINEDTIFSTASIVKIPILIGILHKMLTGELQYHQRLTYTRSEEHTLNSSHPSISYAVF